MPPKDRHPSSLTLAIGPHVVTLFETRTAGRHVEVTRRWEIDTPTGALAGAAVQDPPRLGAALRALWRKAGVRERSVSVVLPPSGYSARSLRLPDIPRAERRAIVRGELEQNGALPHNGGGFDFLWMTAAPGGTPDVHAYYAGDALINPLREALDEGGLRLRSLEPTSLATMRAYLSTVIAGQPVAILCPAERYSDLCIHDGNEIRLLRRIPTGWADLEHTAQRPQEHTELGAVGEMEQPRRQQETVVPTALWGEGESGVVGFMSEPAAPADAAPEPLPVPPPGETVVVPRERSLLEDEVARSFAFYAREHQDRLLPSSLVIVGTDEVVQRFEKVLADTVPAPVVALNLLSELNLPPTPVLGSRDQDPVLVAALYGVAAGTAGHECGIEPLDISQQDRAKGLGARGRRRLVYVGLGGAALLLAVAGLAAGSLTLAEMNTRGVNTQILKNIRAIEVVREPILRYHTVSTSARALRGRTQLPVGSVLGRVAAAANAGISLRSLQFSADGKLALQGSAASPRHLEQFGRELSQGATVRLPVIERMQRGQKGVVDFGIAALVRRAPEEAEKSPQGGGDNSVGM